MTVSQFVSLLRSFGLTCTPVTGHVQVPSVAVGTGDAPSPSLGGENGATADPVADHSAVAESSAAGRRDDGWTQVRGRRRPPAPSAEGTASGALVPEPGAQRPRAKETAVMAALRRNEEEKRARDARRARLIGRAREGLLSPVNVPPSGLGGEVGQASPLAPSPGGQEEPSTGRGTVPPTSTPRGIPSPMGPPPPPLLRPKDPPPALPTGHQCGQSPTATPPPTPRPLETPAAPRRPTKRDLSWSGSPSEEGAPRARHKTQPSPSGGRASSADSRLGHSGLHPRVQFRGGDPASGTDRV